MDIIDVLFGHGKDLSVLQMSCRAFAMFFITLLLIFISGMRTFGSKSAFDNIIVIILGAVLSRAVVGVSPAIPVIAAGFTISIIHRIMAILSFKFKIIGFLMKSSAICLYKDGKLNEKNLRKCNISKEDLQEGIRLNGSVASLESVTEVYMERNGQISVVKKKDG